MKTKTLFSSQTLEPIYKFLWKTGCGLCAAGVALIYVYIAFTEEDILTKILWCSVLSILIGIVLLAMALLVSDLLKPRK